MRTKISQVGPNIILQVYEERISSQRTLVNDMAKVSLYIYDDNRNLSTLLLGDKTWGECTIERNSRWISINMYMKKKTVL